MVRLIEKRWIYWKICDFMIILIQRMANINVEVLTNYMFLVLGIIALIPSIVGILAYKNFEIIVLDDGSIDNSNKTVITSVKSTELFRKLENPFKLFFFAIFRSSF